MDYTTPIFIFLGICAVAVLAFAGLGLAVLYEALKGLGGNDA